MYYPQKGDLCPLCERGKLQEKRKNVEFNYKGKTKTFENERVLICNLCQYESLSPETNKRIEKDLSDFRRSVDGLLTSDRMRSIREKLGLNKIRMAALIAVNEKTVGRYECGKVTQSPQVDMLYRIFAEFPEVVRFLSEDYSLFQITAIQKSQYVPVSPARYKYHPGIISNNPEEMPYAKAA